MNNLFFSEASFLLEQVFNKLYCYSWIKTQMFSMQFQSKNFRRFKLLNFLIRVVICSGS